MFKRKHLEVMKLTRLYEIAKDLDLGITRKTKKGELIEKLLESKKFNPEMMDELPKPGDELPSMSVQVRRIYESSKGERL